MPFNNGFALVIGVGQYQNMSHYNVPIASQDAEAVSSVLQDSACCGYLAAQVTTLTNEKATCAAVLATLDGLASLLQDEDILLLFFAGHGTYDTDGNYYLATYDIQLQDKQVLAGTGVSENDLIEKLSNIRAKRILLVINACHADNISSSLAVDALLGSEAPPLKLSEALFSTGEGRITITACRPEQKSWIGTGDLSIFSAALVNGLKGDAPNNNGYISAFGLYEYIYHQSKAAAAELGKVQEPELTLITGVDPFPVALYRGASALGNFDTSAPIPAETATHQFSAEKAQRRYQQYQATLNGDGAIAQGDGATAVGKGGILIGGSVSGNVVIGNTGYTADDVSVLITQIKTTFQPKPFDGRCPYKGLDVFDEEDSELFFGREKLVDDLVNRVKDSRTIFITGPSGSGKSSLVRAGLIHALKRGAIKNSERWLYATMKPGRDPIGELARVASTLAGSTNAEDEIRAKALADATIFARWCEIALKEGREKRIVLFIDQFEEVFTQINKEAERIAFLDLLTHAATAENRRVIVLFSMRSDFVSNCAKYPKINALMSQQFIQIGAMLPDELVSAIAQPALRVGLQIDPDLIAQVITDMKSEPGALPLMQFALKDLFDAGQAKGGVIALTRANYLQRGGIQKSLERHADAAFAKLESGERELAQSIFSGLIEIGQDMYTRRTVLFDELVTANTNAAEVKAIVQKLADARLITTDERAGKDIVTISHEKLIDAWPWLKKLANENKDMIALKSEISTDAAEWCEHQRDASYLYSGGRLLSAREKLEMQKLMLSGLALEFVKAGQAKQRRRQIITTSGIVAVIVISILVALVFRYQSYIAQTNADLATSRELAAAAVSNIDVDPERSILLALQAETTNTIEADNALHRSILASRTIFTLNHGGQVKNVVYSPDYTRIATASSDGTAKIWDAATGELLATLSESGHTDEVWEIAYSPDGKRIATSSMDSTAIIWDADSGKPLFTLHHDDAVWQVAFSPDGTRIATASEDGTVKVWDATSGDKLLTFSDHKNPVNDVAFSPDGKRIVSTGEDQIIHVWDSATGTEFFSLPIENAKGLTLFSVNFSPDGKRIAGVYDNGISYASVWNATTGDVELSGRFGHVSALHDIVFSRDGKLMAAGGEDQKTTIWDSATGNVLYTLAGHTSTVGGMAFNKEGTRIVTASYDGTARVWDLTPAKEVQFISFKDSSTSPWSHHISYSPDGRHLLSDYTDTNARIWDALSGNQVMQFSDHDTNAIYTTYSWDGKLAATANEDKTMMIWDAQTGKRQATLPGAGDDITAIAFSPDGSHIASVNKKDGQIVVWNIASSKASSPIQGSELGVTSVAYSPDGKRLITGNYDENADVWDAATGDKVFALPVDGVVSSVTYSLDGKRIALGAKNGDVSIWDAVTGKQMLTLQGHTVWVSGIAFSSDGKLLATASDDGTARLWDTASGVNVLTLPVDSAGTGGVSFSPDGNHLAVGGVSGIAIFDLQIEDVIKLAMTRVTRSLTLQECQQYLHVNTCPAP